MQTEYIDHMGSDLTVVNAARVSFNKEASELGDKDERLIRYLATHNHFTPFTHPQITLRETVPIFVARQRFKHVIGFTYNEVSRRYVDDEPSFFQPIWRNRPADSIKQGSAEPFFPSTQGRLNHAYHLFLEDALAIYKRYIAEGVAPEQARMVLPQSMYTSYYVTGSLAAWARAYKLRADDHAQKEIQDLATEWGKHIEPLFPVCWKALTQLG